MMSLFAAVLHVTLLAQGIMGCLSSGLLSVILMKYITEGSLPKPLNPKTQNSKPLGLSSAQSQRFV